MPDTAKGPLPFIIAVTGHRDIGERDIEPIAGRVRALLLRLRDSSPHTQIELLTPLAEGADRLAARVAVQLGIPLIAALPLDPEEYKKDFADDASRQEFDGLLAQASRRFVLPAPDSLDPRPECYVHVGSFIVQHCHLLIALWDGKPTGKRGGTANVVDFSIKEPDPKYARYGRPLDPSESGVVCHIVTPRLSGERPDDAFKTNWLMRGGQGLPAQQALEQMLDSTERFNARAVDTSNGAAEERARREGYLVGSAPPEAADLKRLASLFATADHLAVRSQTSARNVIKVGFVVVFALVVLFEATTEIVEPRSVSRVISFSYVILFGAGYLFIKWAQSRGFDNNYLDYRSFAEALRVQYYWRLAGIDSSVAEHYMRYQLKQSEWIRRAILARDLHDQGDTGRLASTPPENGVSTAIKEWVQGQDAFFTRAEARDQKHRLRLSRTARALAALSLVAFVIFMWRTQWHYVTDGNLPLVLSIAILGAGAAALSGYAEKRALEAQMKRYARMKGIFQTALRKLQRPHATGDDARWVLRELGKEALEENADWVMLHRDRPLETPRGPGG